MQLPTVLLTLIAAYKTGLCDVPCPLHCISSFVVPTNTGVRWIEGPAAKDAARLIEDIAETRPSAPVGEMFIEGEKAPVPLKLRGRVIKLLKAHPGLSRVVLEVLRSQRTTTSLPRAKGKQATPPSDEPETEPYLVPTGGVVQPIGDSRVPFDSLARHFESVITEHPGPSSHWDTGPTQFGPVDAGPVVPAPKRPLSPEVSESPGSRRSKTFNPERPEQTASRPFQLDDLFHMDTFLPKQSVPSRPGKFEGPAATRVKRPYTKESKLFNPVQEPSRPAELEPFDRKRGKPNGPVRTEPSGAKSFMPVSPQDSSLFGPEFAKPTSSGEVEIHSPGYGRPSAPTNPKAAVIEPHQVSGPEGTEPSGPGDSEPSVYKSKFSNLQPFQPSGSEPSMPSGPEPFSQQGRRPSKSVNELTTSELDERTPELNIPGFDNMLPKDRAVPEDVRAYLEFLGKNPSYFVPVFKILANRGVQFPDVTKPINHVTFNGKRVNLPKRVTAAYTVKINDQPFTLPRDAQRLATFVSEHPEQLPAVTALVRQLGGNMTPDSGGKVSRFTLFDKKTHLPQSVAPRVVVNGRPFTLPRDMKLLVTALQDNPEQLYKVLPILEMYGVRPEKSPSGEIKSINIDGDSLPVRSVTPVSVTVRGRRYSIPADLETILRQPDSQVIGELMSALQRSKIPVVVDKQTGNVVGIKKDGVPIPFPVALRLAIQMNGRNFVIPRDLPSVVTHLERHGMPSSVLTVLYDNYGVIPVRDPDQVVRAIEFNGKRYPVRPQPKTSVDVGGNNFVLPRDNEKLIRLVSKGEVPMGEFLRVIQEADYRLVPGPDGVLQSAHRGFEVLPLPRSVRLMITINDVKYGIPHDLPRVVKLLGTIQDGSVVDRILDGLKRLGVSVRKDPEEVSLSFNGKKYRSHLRPQQPSENGGSDGAPGATIRVNFNGRWFALPKDAAALVETVRASGPEAIAMLVKTLRSNGVQVNLTPSGDDIESFVIQGKEVRLSGGGSADVSRPEAAPPGSTTVGGGDSGGKLRVTIRGREFTMPEDIVRAPKVLAGFQYGELIAAVHRAGAKWEVDDRGRFYGMRLRGGRLVKLPVVFRVSVLVDQSGRSFSVPKELDQLARKLSSDTWDWKAVRKTLADAGVEVRGGTGGAPRAIGFQGKFFELRAAPAA